MQTRLIEVDGRDAAIEVTCEAGTYIRTFARDLGLLIGHPVELKELRRTQSGRFKEPQSITLQDLKDAFWLWQEKGEEVAIRRILTPIESLVQDLPKIVVKDGAAAAIAHGAPLMRPGIVSISDNLERGDKVRLVTLKEELVALATMHTRSEMVAEMKEGEIARPDAVFLPPETYPRTWKKNDSPADL